MMDASKLRFLTNAEAVLLALAAPRLTPTAAHLSDSATFELDPKLLCDAGSRRLRLAGHGCYALEDDEEPRGHRSVLVAGSRQDILLSLACRCRKR